MGAPLERDERVLTGESGGSRHLSKGIGCHEDLDEYPGHNARSPICYLSLHRVYPHLTCLDLGHFKGNICYPGLTIAHLPLRAPVYLEWFLHLPDLDAIVACDWSMCSFRFGHRKPEISCDDDLRERLLYLFNCSTHVAFLLASRQCLLWHELSSALLESFLLFRSILRPASKGPEAHEGVGEDRTPGHSQQ